MRNRSRNLKFPSPSLEIPKLQTLSTIMFRKVKKRILKEKKNLPKRMKRGLVRNQVKEKKDLVQEVDKKGDNKRERGKEADLNNLIIETMKSMSENKEVRKQREVKSIKNKSTIKNIEVEIRPL